MKKFEWFLPAIHCIFFDIELHEKRCFLNDIPQETQMIWIFFILKNIFISKILIQLDLHYRLSVPRGVQSSNNDTHPPP